MKTPSSRQAQFEFVERLVAGVLQRVFRLHSNARLRSRNKLHAYLLPLDGVARAKRRYAPRRLQGRHYRKRHNPETPMNSNAQNNLIVSGKSQKQKQPAKVCSSASREKLRRVLPGDFRKMRRIRIGRAALPAPAHTLEISSGMIALGFARRRFLVGLHVSHTFVDAFENLVFREPGVFQPADFRAAHGALAF